MKYIIYAELMANGYVEKHDIIGAIFGQTEGLLSSDLDLRDLQKSGRIGRIDVELDNTNGKSYAKIILPSSLDKVETAILAATLETIDRVGPCLATVRVVNVEDIRIKKRQYITNRAKELLKTLIDNMVDTYEITEEIKEYIRTEEIIEYGEEKLPAGPNIDNSDAIIVVEGRADVINLLRCGIKNVIAVEGTSIPKTIMELSRKKTTTIFTDGDRGGELILKEALQTCDIDYIARAPHGKEVEDLSKKEVVKYLRSKIPIEQYIQLNANKGHVINNYSTVINKAINDTQTMDDLASGIYNKEKMTGISECISDVSQLNESEVLSELKNEEEIKETHNDDKKDGDSDNRMSYEIFKTDDYVGQLNYIKSSMEEILGTNKVKIIGDGFEEIKSINELNENEYANQNINFFISDVPITQKIVDLFYKIKTHLEEDVYGSEMSNCMCFGSC